MLNSNFPNVRAYPYAQFAQQAEMPGDALAFSLSRRDVADWNRSAPDFFSVPSNMQGFNRSVALGVAPKHAGSPGFLTEGNARFYLHLLYDVFVAGLEQPQRESAKREALRAEIEECATLPFDWDGEDGDAPPREEIDNALSFIPEIPEAGLDGVAKIVGGGGEIGFDWDTPQHWLTVSFLRGKIIYFGKLPNGGGKLKGSETYNKNAVPEKLRRLLNANFAA